MNIEAIRTADGISLKGLFLETKENNRICLFIPGCCGNFVDNDFMRIIGMTLLKNQYNVLCANTRGSFMMNSSFHSQNLERPKQIGVAYECFEDCVYDIDAWVEFLDKFGYEEIILLCHSMGCNKIVYYLNQKDNNKISKVILLSPQDNVNFSNLDMHSGLLEEAEKNIKKGEPDKILSKKFLGFCLMSSETYYQEITNKNINNIPYKTPNGDFSLLNTIHKPIYIIIGSDDIGENGKEYMQKVINNCQNAKYTILADANHNFKDKELELNEIIFDYLDE